MKKIKALVERGKDGSYGIYMDDCFALNYFIHGDGKTYQEALDDFYAVYAEMKQYYQEAGEPFEEVEFEFRPDVVSYLTYYASFFTLVGLSKITGINKGQLSHYITGRSTPRPATVKRLETALQQFGQELTALPTLP